MRVLLRNLQTGSPLVLNMGSEVTPTSASIGALSAVTVITDLSLYEFRNLPDIDGAIIAGSLSISHSGGIANLN